MRERSTIATRERSGSPRVALAGLFAVLLAACQIKSVAAPANFITADQDAFALHSVDRYQDQSAGSDSMIVLVKATYTNRENLPETVMPANFVLLDPNSMAVFYGVNGGGVYFPDMPQTRVDPGKSVEIAVGFRVPATLVTARLAYHQ